VNHKLDYNSVHGVVNCPSWHFRGNLQRHERRASFNYDDGIQAKYSRRLWGRSFSEIGHYLPPNYFRTWYLNIYAILQVLTHIFVLSHTDAICGSVGCRNCTTSRNAVPSVKHKAASGNGNSSKNTSPSFYGGIYEHTGILVKRL